jgi:hypothetical protein
MVRIPFVRVENPVATAAPFFPFLSLNAGWRIN